MSDFTVEQMLEELKRIRDELKKPLPPLPPVQSFESWCQQHNPPAPQAQKEVEQAKRQPLHQATVEDETESTMESTTKHGSSMAVNKSILSTIPRLHAARSSGNSAACPSNLVASFFGDFLTSFFGSASLLGYIRCMEGMEATGQG